MEIEELIGQGLPYAKPALSSDCPIPKFMYKIVDKGNYWTWRKGKGWGWYPREV